MFDFIINLFAEIADFFITFWADNVIDKFAKKISKPQFNKSEELMPEWAFAIIQYPFLFHQ